MSMPPTPRELELEKKLTDRDRELDALKAQIAALTDVVTQLTPRGGNPAAAAGGTPLPFANMPRANMSGGPAAAAPTGGPAPRAASPSRPSSARPMSPRQARPSSPRPLSPRGPSNAGQGTAFGSTLSSARARKGSPGNFFHASMRGGPLTEPLQQRGLTPRERADPQRHIRGPSLLTREKHGAKRSEWERFKLAADGGGGGGNFFEDDNPFNDPFQYRPFKGLAFPPSDYTGPDDPRETDDMGSLTPNALKLGFVYGYTGRRARQNLFYNADGKLVYHCAALGVVYDKEAHEQLHFHGHDDDITALDMHPNKLYVVTGQMGKDPKILIWSSRPEKGGRHLPQLCVIHGDHKRAIVGLSFNRTGEYVATMGKDNNRSIAIYRWSRDKKLSDMRVAIDKGHNDDVYALAYNPVTDHVVAVGKKFIRFFGIKEGVEEAAGDARDQKLSEHESKMWAKKGVFGKGRTPGDITCVAFASGGTHYDGTTFVGSADGCILRFAEQATDLTVRAHPFGDEAKGVCKVTALYFCPRKLLLVSSGDDGFIRTWDPAGWPPRGGAPRPLNEIDFNAWVTPELRGLPISLNDRELEKANPKCGRPAAAHSLSGDEHGNLLVGTVCNEIYEISLDSQEEAPYCYMQGHYDELWAYAPHPTKLEFCTGSEDATLRVWDIERRQMRAMAKIEGPIRCCCYSPDGKWIAVGLGSGGKAKPKGGVDKSEGKWIVLDAEDLQLRFSPPQVRHERCSDIKFSPDGRFIAVGNADNFIDVYSVPGRYSSEQSDFRRRWQLKGHSSFINHLDWDAASSYLQSNCGAHELLYWKLWDPDPTAEDAQLRPRQEKQSSKMRDTEWVTQSCIFGWALRGIWPEDADGTDVNACCRSNTGARELLATADDFGTVKLFRYPCIVPRADHRPYGGHSSHVTNIGFTHNDQWLVSTGGDDRGVFQWQVTKER
jgi:microtubule-associated protein-like 6